MNTYKKTKSTTRNILASTTLAAAMFATMVLPASAQVLTPPSYSVRASAYALPETDENVAAATSWDDLRFDESSKDTLVSEGFSAAQINKIVTSARTKISTKPIED